MDRYTLVMVDHITKWLGADKKASTIADKKASTTVQVIFQRYVCEGPLASIAAHRSAYLIRE